MNRGGGLKKKEKNVRSDYYSCCRNPFKDSTPPFQEVYSEVPEVSQIRKRTTSLRHDYFFQLTTSRFEQLFSLEGSPDRNIQRESGHW